MPQVFDTTTILRFTDQAEDQFAEEFKCIVDRYALNITPGVSDYILPDYVTDIRRVTYKGKKMYPVNYRSYREIEAPLTSLGTPNEYIFNNIGQNTIKLYPTPNETIFAVQSNLFGSEIPNRCIVEFHRAPDHINFTIPLFFKRRLVKAYALKMCFAMEGKGQNLKASKYWDSKWSNLVSLYGALVEELINSPRRLVQKQFYSHRVYPQPPVLPTAYRNVGVDAGE